MWKNKKGKGKMTYLQELQKSMNLLGENGYIFIGQNMKFGGTSMFHTVKHLPIEQRIELPVSEEMQMGMSIGMSLEGLKIVSVYPRMDFLLLAMNELINHLDKAEEMSDGQFKPKVIIRTCVGSVKPMMPGPQHMQDYSKELKTFTHPERAIYILGQEDGDLPDSLCMLFPTIRIPTIYCLNVCVAGSIVMYDRIIKQTSPVLNR